MHTEFVRFSVVAYNAGDETITGAMRYHPFVWRRAKPATPKSSVRPPSRGKKK